MSDTTTISNLPAAGSAGLTDRIPVDQISGSLTVTRYVTVEQIATLIGGGGGGSFTLTSAVLQAALITLIQGLPTAPIAGTPTLWSNSGTPEYS